MADSLNAFVRKELKRLKLLAGQQGASKLSDQKIADAMIERIVGDKTHVRAYQQKVNDFFSGEMKKPDLDFLSALCQALGTKLSALIVAYEQSRPVDIENDPDWAWVMFGRKLGNAGRAAAIQLVHPDVGHPGRSKPAGRAPRSGKTRASNT